MAISIDWASKVITVPKADTALVDIGPPEIRSLDINQFRKDLNALQASEAGMAFDITHTHNAPVSVAGITLARVVEIINGYTVTFEAGTYRVNLTSANNNLIDVLNYNSVQVVPSNSAGLVDGSIVDQMVEDGWTVQMCLRVIAAAMAAKLSGAGTNTMTFRDMGDGKDRITATVDVLGNRTAITYDTS